MESKVTCVGALFIRQMTFKEVGDFMPGHSHMFDHQTLLSYGSLRAEVEGKVVDFKAPQMIFIRKGKIHNFTALEPNTVAYCVHPLRDGDNIEDIIDPEGDPFGTGLRSDTKSLVDHTIQYVDPV
jgi:quercetin dioxygenase-like cupin family protein